jgi:hypothetical protein
MIEEQPFAVDRVYYGEIMYKRMAPVMFTVTYVSYQNQKTFKDMVKYKIVDWGNDEVEKSKTERTEIEELIKKEINDRWKEATLIMS